MGPPRLLHDGKHDGDEDHVVDVEISFYNDSTCTKPIAEKGEPIIAHIEIDSSKEQAQCREIPGGGFGSHYQYWCHPSGNEISGQLLCNPDCSACLVSTDDKKEDGSSDFPFGEMKLDECLSLPEMEGSYLKFLGECPNAGVSSTSTMVLLLCILLPLVVVVLFGLYVMKRRRENETGNWFSGASTSTVVDGGADGYSAPEYAKL